MFEKESEGILSVKPAVSLYTLIIPIAIEGNILNSQICTCIFIVWVTHVATMKKRKKRIANS